MKAIKTKLSGGIADSYAEAEVNQAEGNVKRALSDHLGTKLLG